MDESHQATVSLLRFYWLLGGCASLHYLLILSKDPSCSQLSVQKVGNGVKLFAKKREFWPKYFFRGWIKNSFWCFFCVLASWAETVIPEDYLVDPANMKRYSVDPADSAFSCMGSVYAVRQSPADGRPAGGSSSSCSHRPAQISSGSSSSTGLRHQTSSPTRNGTYLEGNRSGNITSSI